LIPFFTENKTAATLAAHGGRHRNQEQWLTLLRGAQQAVSAMLPAVIETLSSDMDRRGDQIIYGEQANRDQEQKEEKLP
jgi:hypothetical protein